MSAYEILAEIKDKQSKLKFAEQLHDNAYEEYRRYEKIWAAREKAKKGTIWVIAGTISLILAICLTISYFKLGGELTLGSLIVSVFVIFLMAMFLFYGLGLHAEASDYDSITNKNNYNYKEELEKVGGEEVAREATEKALKEWEERKKECERLSEELEPLQEKLSEVKAELKGKYWELSEFKATPGNIKAMEQDVEKLFRYLECVDDPKEAISNWICRARMEHFNAVMNKDEATQKAQDAGLTEMNESGSWKLDVVVTVLLYMDMAIMSAAFGGEMQGGLDWLVSKSTTYREPETEDEKQFYELAKNACVTMSDGVRYVLRKELKGKVSY